MFCTFLVPSAAAILLLFHRQIYAHVNSNTALTYDQTGRSHNYVSFDNDINGLSGDGHQNRMLLDTNHTLSPTCGNQYCEFLETVLVRSVSMKFILEY